VSCPCQYRIDEASGLARGTASSMEIGLGTLLVIVLIVLVVLALRRRAV
jgi:hypothetical protein